jgi:hypothetical protein
MRRNINILNNSHKFEYLVEYTNSPKNVCSWEVEFDNSLEYHENHNVIEKNDVHYGNKNNDIILVSDRVDYYRDINEWYNINTIQNKSNLYIPNNVKTSNIKVYIPTYSVSDYLSGFKYVVSANTWINGVKINLGSMIFGPNDTYASPVGTIKNGNNEYFECIDFDIIDPGALMYADDWINFRHNICGEPKQLNSTGSILKVSIHIVNNSENNIYRINSECTGGYTDFNIVNDNDYLSLNICKSLNPLGFTFNVKMNNEYNWLLSYLKETYGIETSRKNIRYELIIKNDDTAIVGDRFAYNGIETYGEVTQTIKWNTINENSGLKIFFNDWNTFEEGWFIVGSLIVINTYINNDGEEVEDEIFSIISNKLPITQNLFSIFINGGAEKIIDINDMNITQYNVVNKIENNIIQVERPEISKSNIITPVFFRVKDTELLTLHPNVTENISINLDDYKSKVDRFILQVDGHKFDQIGANSYGILFRIPANVVSTKSLSGTYYVLNENYELITTGKYNCVV